MTHQKGFSLIESLVTLVILMLGLLGLVGLQTRMAAAEMESYEREQGLALLNDMTQQLRNNARAAACYSTTGMDPKWVGTGAGTPGNCAVAPMPTATDGVDQAKQDLTDWHNALLGNSETTGSGGSLKRLGAMIDARGCVAPVAGTTKTYLVTVAWTGLTSTTVVKDYMTTTAAAGAAIDCASTAYADLATRRAVSALVRLPDLDCVPTATPTNCE